jgi:hypothetical protein
MFANLYLDSLGKQIGMPSIDWTMGPIVFRSELASLWTDYNGDLWDAQLVPLVQAFQQRKAKIVSCEIDYCHPMEMKQEEEGSSQWGKKRLLQLIYLFEKVGGQLESGASSEIIR